MIAQRIRHLPVVQAEQVVGVITRIDVLRHHLDKQHSLSRELEGYITGVYSAA
jgi:signal-transduction protein with cAMP-binding, CBS, and nucleotidyltransferase domain